MKDKPTLKTMILGLDGATFDVMLPFIKEKKLPTLAYLLEKGAWGELESTIPPVTAAAWPSFMTGENPGKHGILDFMQATIGGKTGGESKEVVSTESFAGRTFLDVMSSRGMKVGVITVPVTYPPWDINGIMISGYPSPDNDKIYSFTKDISIDIKEPLNFSAEYYKTASEEEIIEDCIAGDRRRADLMFDLLSRYDFDCFVVVLGGIDRSQHDYWKYYDPDYPNVPKKVREKFRDSVFRNYKLADDQIAKFLEIYGDITNLFIISDHGFGRQPFNYFNVNLWLRNHGWLAVERSKALARETLRKIYYGLALLFTPKERKKSFFLEKLKSMAPMMGGGNSAGGGSGSVFAWEKTRAFDYPLAYPTGGIMINVKGRQPKGIVDAGQEYDELVNTIIQELLEYRDHNTGGRVVERALKRDELYQGPYVHNFPDIVYVLNPNYESGKELFGGEITSVPALRLSKKSGLHRMNGIFIAYGPGIKACHIQGAKIIDVAPTILYCGGLPIPDNMDGVILTDIFKEEVLQQHQAEYLSWKWERPTKEVVLETQEHDEMKEKLRSLGYL